MEWPRNAWMSTTRQPARRRATATGARAVSANTTTVGVTGGVDVGLWTGDPGPLAQALEPFLEMGGGDRLGRRGTAGREEVGGRGIGAVPGAVSLDGGTHARGQRHGEPNAALLLRGQGSSPTDNPDRDAPRFRGAHVRHPAQSAHPEGGGEKEDEHRPVEGILGRGGVQPSDLVHREGVPSKGGDHAGHGRGALRLEEGTKVEHGAGFTAGNTKTGAA